MYDRPLVNLIDTFEEILKSNDIAEAFNVDYDVWQTHVKYDLSDHQWGNSRGRYPYIAYEVSSNEFEEGSNSGGTNTYLIAVRLYVGKGLLNNNKKEAQLKCDTAIRKILYKSREEYIMSTSQDLITIGELVSAPWGYFQDVTMYVDMSYDKSNYGDFE